jgi:hypothetical protein
MYTRSEINPCKANLLNLTTVLESAGHAEKQISLQEAATVNSISGAQGYTRCKCKTKCKTNRCACRSASRIFNSKCHGGLPCENKTE